jgi:hypothetical protein
MVIRVLVELYLQSFAFLYIRQEYPKVPLQCVEHFHLSVALIRYAHIDPLTNNAVRYVPEDQETVD